MKIHLIALFSLLSLSFVAQANKAQDHEAFCDSEEVKAIKGEKGSCRILIDLNSTSSDKPLFCGGVFMKALPCMTMFFSFGNEAGLKLTCGPDKEHPVIDTVLPAKASAYSVSALITKEDGSEVLVTDSKKYMSIESDAVIINMTTETKAEVATNSASMAIMTRMGIQELTDVICQ